MAIKILKQKTYDALISKIESLENDNQGLLLRCQKAEKAMNLKQEKIEGLKSKLTANRFVIEKLISENCKLTPKAEKWEKELERSRVKSKIQNIQRMSLKAFAKKFVGFEVKSNMFGKGKICGYDPDSKLFILFGKNDKSGTKIDTDVIFKEFESYSPILLENAKEQVIAQIKATQKSK